MVPAEPQERNKVRKTCTLIPVMLLAILMAHPGWAGVVSKETPERFELEFWRAIKDSSDPAEFQAYIESYPDGRFVTLAKIRAKSLSRSTTQKAPGDANSSNRTNTGLEKAKTESPPVTSTALEPKIEQQIAKAPEPVSPVRTTEKQPAIKSAPATRSAEDLAKMASTEFRDCTSCPLMVEIPAGQFTMGANDADSTSAPARQVTIDYDFAAGRYEITHSQWKYCVEMGGCVENSHLDELQGEQPAVNLSWIDARLYVDWLSEYTRRPYRLPTEAEWEYIARAGTQSAYWWGEDIIADSANCRNCGGDWGRKLPAPTDAFIANQFGLFSTSGGVAEWVQDCWQPNHRQSPSDGSAVILDSCNTRVLRGGSWRNDKSYLLSSSRLSYDHNVRYSANGLRVVLDYDHLMAEPDK